MKNTEKESYLGDFVTKKANSNATLVAWKSCVYAILSEIRAILTEIPLGSRRMEIGLALWDAWFLNGILFNSEVLGAYAEKHVEELMVIDNMILRTVVGAQSKMPLETLSLESSTLSIKHVITLRQMLYLKTILSRHEDEINRRVYTAIWYRSFAQHLLGSYEPLRQVCLLTGCMKGSSWGQGKKLSAT